jgi:hypothetical protein
VSYTTGNDWNMDRGGTAAAMTRAAGFERISMRHRVAAVRDTLIVLAMQIVFRTTMFLRHLNY